MNDIERAIIAEFEELFETDFVKILWIEGEKLYLFRDGEMFSLYGMTKSIESKKETT